MARKVKKIKVSNADKLSAMLRDHTKNRSAHNLALKSRRTTSTAAAASAKASGAAQREPAAAATTEDPATAAAATRPDSATPPSPLPVAKRNGKRAERAAGMKTAPPRSSATPAGPLARDSRLPDPGTTLRKLDRQGAVRCECVVEDGGIRYKGTTYRSLSAAAVAAAKDLGIGGAQNGYVFWGLVKPARTTDGDPVLRLQKSWDRYASLARSLVKALPEDKRPSIVAAIERNREMQLP